MRTTKTLSCPNADCSDQGSSEQVIKAGKDKRGHQRYLCKQCGQGFSASKGTLFYRLRKPKKDFLEALALLVERGSMAAVARIKGIKEETVARWAEKAGQQAQAVEEILLRDFHLSQVQLNELWTYLRNKGGKGGTRRANGAGSSGRRPPLTPRAS